MTDGRRRRLHAFAIIALVVIGHAGLISALALAGEWRVWRFIMNVTAQLYGLAGIGWIGWHVFAAPAHAIAPVHPNAPARANSQARVMTAVRSVPGGAVMLAARRSWSRLAPKTLRGRGA